MKVQRPKQSSSPHFRQEEGRKGKKHRRHAYQLNLHPLKYFLKAAYNFCFHLIEFSPLRSYGRTNKWVLCHTQYLDLVPEIKDRELIVFIIVLLCIAIRNTYEELRLREVRLFLESQILKKIIGCLSFRNCLIPISSL